MDGTVYKICSKAALAEARAKGGFDGSSDDLHDGFIHFSSAEQLEGTLTKHFAGEANLVLLAVNTERLGERLQWEPSRGGEVFPHLYGPLDLGVVLWVEPLTLGADGRYRLPARVLP
ncbi:MAG: DUF952 domain-containing protein [Methyloceanibacter sp.]